MKIETRAYRKTIAEQVKAAVTRHAEAVDYGLGYLDAVAVELQWSKKKLSRILGNANLRVWWAKFKRETSKRRRAARRRRARERAIANGRGWVY